MKDTEECDDYFETDFHYNTDISIAEDCFLEFIKKATSVSGKILLNFELLCDAYCYLNDVRYESVEAMVKDLINKKIIVNNMLIIPGFVLSSNTPKRDIWESLLNDTDSPKSNYFEVYVVHGDNGECLYVGEGKKNRHLHTMSGRSHVYELNKLHFDGCAMTVTVVHTCDSKSEATRLESELIGSLKPLFNKRIPSERAP